MFKTISAALLAVSVLAAPAFAATGKTTQAPVIKSTQTKSSPVKANANVKIGKHHGKYHHTKYVRHHNRHKIAAHRTHAKVSYKPAAHNPTKRG